MTQEILLTYYYDTSNIQEFSIDYKSTQSVLGVRVNETIDFGPLYDLSNNLDIGKIQFNNINRVYLTYPTLYNITENIQIQIGDNTSISFINYYKSDNQYYPNGSKYIIPIISCTGLYVGKKGYVVIDVIDKRRILTIKLN